MSPMFPSDTGAAGLRTTGLSGQSQPCLVKRSKTLLEVSGTSPLNKAAPFLHVPLPIINHPHMESKGAWDGAGFQQSQP